MIFIFATNFAAWPSLTLLKQTQIKYDVLVFFLSKLICFACFIDSDIPKQILVMGIMPIDYYVCCR